jgi:hypothetical protein
MKESEPFVDDDADVEKKNKQEGKVGGVVGWQLVKDAFWKICGYEREISKSE